ncbi:MAG: DnaB-like helicase C-terminal domain-containing protein [Bacteroidales bacterium]|nr:DnaB-like helicase C-terminal domain-containing protein [Bacteroidales bacterium]
MDEQNVLKAERVLIGDILLGGNVNVDIADSKSIREDSFTDQLCRDMWTALKEAHDDGVAIDYVTLMPYVTKHGISLTDFMKFTDSVASDVHIEDHCNLLNAYRLERVSEDIQMRFAAARDNRERVNLISIWKSLITEFEDNASVEEFKHVSDVVKRADDEMDRRVENFYSGELAGISTGFPKLNMRTNGWQKGTLNIVAARPGMGKTAFAVKFALEAAKKGHPVCFFAMEMRDVRITDRIGLSLTDIDGEKFRRGELSNEEKETFKRAGGELSRLPLYICDKSNCTTAYIHAAARRMKDKGQCDMLIIDYLQLVDMSTGAARSYTRENMVTAASRAFKVLAKELDIPVILLSQLNRAAEGRADRKPMLSDLRESGSIEQDADTVLLIHRPEYYNQDEGVRKNEAGEFRCGVGEMILAKQREGSTGGIEFYYNRSLTRLWDNDLM